MRISVLAIGTRMPAWVNEAVKAYQKRLPRHIEFDIREIAPAQRGSNTSADALKQKEGEALLKALPDKTLTIALDERGKSWTSVQLGQQLETWLAEHPHVTLLIGGADGLSAEVKRRADLHWSLSPLTLPHALVRVVLAEQIYRAWTLVQGHPYHRE